MSSDRGADRSGDGGNYSFLRKCLEGGSRKGIRKDNILNNDEGVPDDVVKRIYIMYMYRYVYTIYIILFMRL